MEEERCDKGFLKMKCTQWRQSGPPRPRGQACGQVPAREDAGAPLGALYLKNH